MKKASCFIMFLIFISLFLFGCGNQSTTSIGEEPVEEAANEFNWKIGIVDPPDYYMTELTVEWADLVSQKTGGKVAVEVFPSGQLGGDIDMLEGLEMGSLQVWEGGGLVLSAVHPINDIWAMPYLYANTEHKYNFWDNHLKEVSDLIAAETGFRIVAVIDGPNRQLTSKKPVNDIGDLQGLIVRVPEIEPFIKLWRNLGASPTAMPFTEVFTALQTGVVDAQENDILLSYSSGFFEVVKYLVITNHVAYEGFIVFNEEYYQNLPDDVKEAISESSLEIMKKSREQVFDMEQEIIEKIQNENDVTVIYPDLEPFLGAAENIVDDYPHIAPIYNIVKESK